MSKKADIIPFLKKHIAKAAIKFQFINKGGCGVFAVALHKELVALKLEPKFYALINLVGEITKEQNRKINNCYSVYEVYHRENFIFSHVVVELNGHYIDAEGVYEDANSIMKNKYNRYTLTELKPSAIKRFSDNPKGWNDKYDRKHNEEVEVFVKDLMHQFKAEQKKKKTANIASAFVVVLFMAFVFNIFRFFSL